MCAKQELCGVVVYRVPGKHHIDSVRQCSSNTLVRFPSLDGINKTAHTLQPRSLHTIII